jgi:regulator of sigma E protease
MLLFQLILSLSLLIILHELGHFIPAKLFKTRVEKFYLFFDPYFSLLKKKVGETTYGIGWLPLGGYVKISGMVDESMDKEQMDRPAEPWEFRSKPAWQRLIIMIGGVVVNIIVGCLIYSAILFTWGRDTLSVQNATYGLHCNPIMYQYGFQEGDKIVAIDGAMPSGQEKVNKTILLDDPRTITILRNNSIVDLHLPEDFGQLLVDSGIKSGCFTVRVPFVIEAVEPNLGAMQAGLLPGDQIVGINEFRSEYFSDLTSKVKKHKSTTVTVHFMRAGQVQSLAVLTDETGRLGIDAVDPDQFLTYSHIEYSFCAALAGGVTEAWETVTDYASQLRFLFSKKGATQVGGFATFAKLFPTEWDWQIFWERTALISLILAFMNILPIPALDGGHVIFLLWEMVSGKAVSQKILERSQMVGMVLLLGLMLYGNGMDAVRALLGD